MYLKYHGLYTWWQISNATDTVIPFILKDILKKKASVNVSLMYVVFQECQGTVSIRKTVLPGMAIPRLKIRRPNGRLIFNMEIAIHR